MGAFQSRLEISFPKARHLVTETFVNPKNISLRINQDKVRDSLDLIIAGHGRITRKEDRIGHLEVLDEPVHPGRVVVRVHSEHNQTGGFVPRIKLLHEGNGHAAGAAPGGPEIEQDGMSAKGGQAYGIAGEVFEFKVGRRDDTLAAPSAPAGREQPGDGKPDDEGASFSRPGAHPGAF